MTPALQSFVTTTGPGATGGTGSSNHHWNLWLTPTPTMSLLTSAVKFKRLKRVPWVICPAPVTAENCARRYSARSVQRGAIATSNPVPTVQPTFDCDVVTNPELATPRFGGVGVSL